MLTGLTAQFYVTVESKGPYNTGPVVAAELIARVTKHDVFIGNWTVMKYYGPDSETTALREMAKIQETI